MSPSVTYREMEPSESADALALVCRVFEEQVRPDLGGDDCREFERMARSVILTPSRLHSILVAAEDGRLVALLATRSDGHVSLFFVDPAYQRRGIGRQLCRVALERARAAGRRPTTVTVKSTPAAVAVYEHLGFRVIPMGGTSDRARLVPMVLTLEDDGGRPDGQHDGDGDR